MTVKVVSTAEESRKQAEETLKDVLAESPLECVVWFRTEDGMQVQTSAIADRTNVVGALTGMAMDLWNQ